VYSPKAVLSASLQLCLWKFSPAIPITSLRSYKPSPYAFITANSLSKHTKKLASVERSLESVTVKSSKIAPPVSSGPVIVPINLGFHFLEKMPPRLPNIFSACKKCRMSQTMKKLL
jgi:hypothetical protein